MLNEKITSIEKARNDRMVEFLNKNNCHLVANYNISPNFRNSIQFSGERPWKALPSTMETCL